MKHLKTLLLAIAVFTFLSFQSIDKLNGKWQIIKIEINGTENVMGSESKKYIQFNEDGTLVGGEMEKEPNRFGSWIYNKADNLLTLKTDNKTEEEQFTLESVAKDTLVLSNKELKVFSKRIK